MLSFCPSEKVSFYFDGQAFHPFVCLMYCNRPDAYIQSDTKEENAFVLVYARVPASENLTRELSRTAHPYNLR